MTKFLVCMAVLALLLIMAIAVGVIIASPPDWYEDENEEDEHNADDR